MKNCFLKFEIAGQHLDNCSVTPGKWLEIWEVVGKLLNK